MNLPFCAVVEKALIYTSDVSSAGLRWLVKGQPPRTLTKQSQVKKELEMHQKNSGRGSPDHRAPSETTFSPLAWVSTRSCVP